ncbi:hypothetical protein BpHYR1_027875 [Brachionus plicatilis]|uniref:Uncharacterized protein n=1 Tax=Brachionus plicatilis TaxID=10195 RepID=A0A3M7PT25_BRAPC|nr:hypothetical protein BpHYR1_027875 [Brachionus plicatilis]
MNINTYATTEKINVQFLKICNRFHFIENQFTANYGRPLLEVFILWRAVFVFIFSLWGKVFDLWVTVFCLWGLVILDKKEIDFEFSKVKDILILS